MTGDALNVYAPITLLGYIQMETMIMCLLILIYNICSQVSPLNDIEKILDCERRPTAAEDGDSSKLGSKQAFVKQYLVKWKGLSYLHCTWQYINYHFSWIYFLKKWFAFYLKAFQFYFYCYLVRWEQPTFWNLIQIAFSSDKVNLILTYICSYNIEMEGVIVSFYLSV